jgi:catechol 2,3-dioxygenase-like lactoylglutathione lyase family enzyme
VHIFNRPRLRNLYLISHLASKPRIAGIALGPTTLLLFQLGLTASDQRPIPGSDSCIPAHGPSQDIISQLTASSSPSSLKQHFCLAVPSRSDVEAWEKHLKANGVKLMGTMDWEKGGRSVYFSDPDGHVGEIGSRGIWAHY